MEPTPQQPSRQAERPSHPAERTRFTDQARVTCRGFDTLPSARHAPGGAPQLAGGPIVGTLTRAPASCSAACPRSRRL